MRENWISNRVFIIYTDVGNHCYDAWNKLDDQYWTVMFAAPLSRSMHKDQRRMVLMITTRKSKKLYPIRP